MEAEEDGGGGDGGGPLLARLALASCFCSLSAALATLVDLALFQSDLY